MYIFLQKHQEYLTKFLLEERVVLIIMRTVKTVSKEIGEMIIIGDVMTGGVMILMVDVAVIRIRMDKMNNIMIVVIKKNHIKEIPETIDKDDVIMTVYSHVYQYSKI